MKKYVAVSALVLMCSITIVFLSSCTKYENVTFAQSDDRQYVLYQGNEYYATDFFLAASKYRQAANENDIELGWYYSFPFSTRFYSDTDKNPIYIYTIGGDNSFYLRQNYDYMSDSFVIENGSEAIILSETISGPALTQDALQSFDNFTEVEMCAKDHAELNFLLRLACENNDWYVILPTDEVYLASQTFEDMLREIKVINN